MLAIRESVVGIYSFKSGYFTIANLEGKMSKNDIKKCPRCKLINLPSAETCDCGYIFTTPDIDEQQFHIYDRMRRRKGVYIIIGGIGSL